MRKTYDILRFTLKCILIPAAAIFIIYCLNKPYRHIDANKYLDVSKFSTLRAFYTEVQIGNIGSSHGAYNFDYTPLTERGYSCFNFANASQSFNYDYAILQEYGHFLTPGSVLFIPVSYFSFNNEVINTSEAQALSVRYYHCLTPENVPDYDPYIDLVTNKFPVLSAGEDILKIFPDLKLSLTVFANEKDKVIDNIEKDSKIDDTDENNSKMNDTNENNSKMNDTNENNDEIIATPDTNFEINIEEFAARAKDRYSRHFDNKEDYFLEERIADLYDILNYCKENKITPVLITTPFSVYYNELVSEEFLREFSETVNRIATDTGVSYYDYSNDERFYDNLIYFADSDHLNEKGCEYFMQVLLEEVSELSIFP